MQNFEIDNIDAIYNNLKALPDKQKGFSVERDSKWRKNDHIFSFDIVVYFFGTPFAVIEFKRDLGNGKSSSPNEIKNLLYKQIDCQIVIITDGTTFYAYDAQMKSPNYQKFKNIYNFLLRKANAPKDDSDVRDKIVAILKDYHLTKYTKFLNKIDDRFSFGEYEEKFIHEFFQESRNRHKVAYRYMSFDSAFHIFEEGKMRMSGLVSMNDKTEIDLIDKHLSSQKSIHIPNDIFISSFSYLEDDLTMWRLYGDDGRGICLKIKIKDNDSKDLKILPIHYLTAKEFKSKSNELKQLQDAGVCFHQLDIWKHFFKMKEYSIEKECRLFYKQKDANLDTSIQWRVTYDMIIDKVKDFDINDLPFEIEQIILGPTCPNQEINRLQIENMIKSNFPSVSVKKSKIKSYR